jgi:CheY-like chemotaxis protein
VVVAASAKTHTREGLWQNIRSRLTPLRPLRRCWSSWTGTRRPRSATEAVLVRRFEPDYHIVTADSATTGLAVLEKLASQGAEVAIVAADLKLPGMDGVAFLELAHELHRDASRVLLLAMDRYHTQIPLSELATLQQATALGRIDFCSEPRQMAPICRRCCWSVCC